MAQHRPKLVTAQSEAFATGGKIASISIAVTGDRIWEIREVDVNGAIRYKLSNALDIPHNDLHIPFKTALFAKVLSGTTGEINIMIE